MLKTKKKFGFKFKKAAAIALTAVTIVSGCVISASAAVQSYTYKVELSSKDSMSFVFNATNNGTQADVFDSYMTIFNGKQTSSGYSQLRRPDGSYTNKIYYTFYSCPDHYTFRYGDVKKGASNHQYVNQSGGGFRGYCTTSQTY